MKIIKTIDELRNILKAQAGKKIGLVPTMGALHVGHASLIKKSVEQNDFTVVSDFVNPVQFGPNEDYDKYPRTLDNDAKIAENIGADVIFAPSPSEMYQNQGETTLVCPAYSDVNKLCGKTRLGHFDGVATVVSKLFNIVRPTSAYFGRKDAQQLFIIQKMVCDLNFDIKIVPCEIVRDNNGLAISSRNCYLDDMARKNALKINQTLYAIRDDVKNGINDVETLIDRAIALLFGLEIDYFEILSLSDFEKIDTIEKNNSIALCAVYVKNENGDRIRLIDNMDLT